MEAVARPSKTEKQTYRFSSLERIKNVYFNALGSCQEKMPAMAKSFVNLSKRLLDSPYFPNILRPLVSKAQEWVTDNFTPNHIGYVEYEGKSPAKAAELRFNAPQRTLSVVFNDKTSIDIARLSDNDMRRYYQAVRQPGKVTMGFISSNELNNVRQKLEHVEDIGIRYNTFAKAVCTLGEQIPVTLPKEYRPSPSKLYR
jgi:hypothetical protein